MCTLAFDSQEIKALKTALLDLVLAWKGRFSLTAVPVSLYHAELAALTVGSCVFGILEIYGTTSDLIPIYWIFGSLTIGSALLLYGLTPKNDMEKK